MKRISADGSVGLPHVRVGHRQALNLVFAFLKKVKTKVKRARLKKRAFLVLEGHLDADIAQVVERILGKDEVPSSSLGISTITIRILLGDHSALDPPDFHSELRSETN